MSVLPRNEMLFEGCDNLQIMGEKNICHSWRVHLSGVYSKGISSLRRGTFALEKKKHTYRLCSWFRQQNDIVSSEAGKVNKPDYANPAQSVAPKSSRHTEQGRMLRTRLSGSMVVLQGDNYLWEIFRNHQGPLENVCFCLILILHMNCSNAKM